MTSKRDLRRQFRATRDAFVIELDQADRARLESELGAILDANLPRGVIAGYAAVGSEIGLGRLPRRFALPRVTTGQPLTFHAADGLLAPAAFAAIPEPLASAARIDPDIVLVPMLAVDPAGNRLGQGGGYYDQTLAMLRARRSILAVGIGWEVQLADRLPADDWDQPLDAIATPGRWLACRVASPTSAR